MRRSTPRDEPLLCGGSRGVTHEHHPRSPIGHSRGDRPPRRPRRPRGRSSSLSWPRMPRRVRLTGRSSRRTSPPSRRRDCSRSCDRSGSADWRPTFAPSSRSPASWPGLWVNVVGDQPDERLCVVHRVSGPSKHRSTCGATIRTTGWPVCSRQPRRRRPSTAAFVSAVAGATPVVPAHVQWALVGVPLVRFQRRIRRPRSRARPDERGDGRGHLVRRRHVRDRVEHHRC